jgi:hypothetical protein
MNFQHIRDCVSIIRDRNDRCKLFTVYMHSSEPSSLVQEQTNKNQWVGSDHHPSYLATVSILTWKKFGMLVKEAKVNSL